jgi:beta-lactamase class A
VRRRNRVIIWIAVIVAGVALALLGWRFINFRSSLSTLPEGMTVSEMDVGGKSIEQALTDLELSLAQEVTIIYQDEILFLSPETVSFQFDAEATRAVIEEAIQDRRGLNGFLAYIRQRESEVPHVQVAANYSIEQLNDFLTLVAQQYDRPPQSSVPLPEVLSFRAGLPGYRMNLEASQERAAIALLSTTQRQAEMIVEVEDAPPHDIAQLEDMLLPMLDEFPGVASVFIKDLQTGEELNIDSDIAFSAMSVIKIAMMVETYRALDTTPTPTQTQALIWTMTESENHTANELLTIVGDGDPFLGVELLTTSMTRLGLANTFMSSPYGEEGSGFTVVTPANSRSDPQTEPDPYMQTTAQDSGLLLEMVYQCAEGGGTLMLVYPDALTPQECQNMLDVMSENQIDSMIEEGLPAGTVLAHKQGLISTTHADAGIAFTPEGDFILTIFLYAPTWLDWEISNPLIGDVATATYNYFNPTE